MNTTCTANNCAPSVGVTESLRKPRYTVANVAEAFEIEVELPGVTKSGVSIDLEEDILSIRGERSGATALSPTAGANVGLALLSDDGKSLTFPSTVTAFVIEYVPKPAVDITTALYPVVGVGLTA